MALNKTAVYKTVVISFSALILVGGIFWAGAMVPHAGFIDKEGNLVVKLPDDAEAGEFHDGLAPVKQGSSWGYINRSGAWVIPPQFAKAGNFSEGLAVVFIKDKKKFAFINRQAKGVLEFDATAVGDFHEGVAMVAKGDQCGYINLKGKFVIPNVYRFVEPRYSSQGVVPVALMFKDKNMPVKWTFVDHKNHPVVPEVFDGAKEVNEALAPVYVNVKEEGVPAAFDKLWGFLANTGKSFAIPPEYTDVQPFSDGYALVTLKPSQGTSKLTFVDSSNKRMPVEVRAANSFSEGFAAVANPDKSGKELKWGYIDKQGKNVIAPRFDVANKFSEGLAFTARKKIRPFWEGY